MYDGDELLAIVDGTLTRFDDKLAVKARIAIRQVRSFALLPDRSLVVATRDTMSRVVKDKVVATHDVFSVLLRATGSSAELWGIKTSGSAGRIRPDDPDPRFPLQIPANVDVMTAEVLADGGLAFAGNDGIVHIDSAVKLYKWNGGARILSRGAEPRTVWANVAHEKLVLLKLENDRAIEKATHVMPKGDRLMHSTSNGALVGGIVAHSVTASEATFSLVAWDETRERFRAPLDGAQHVGRIAVMSGTRIAALASPPGKMVAFDLATGKPV